MSMCISPSQARTKSPVLACGNLPLNSRTKWLLGSGQVHFDSQACTKCGPRSSSTCKFSRKILQTACPHWGVLTVSVKAGAWSGCSSWSPAFYLLNSRKAWVLWHVHVHFACAGSHKVGPPGMTWLLWHVQLHFDCAGSYKVWVPVLGSVLLLNIIILNIIIFLPLDLTILNIIKSKSVSFLLIQTLSIWKGQQPRSLKLSSVAIRDTTAFRAGSAALCMFRAHLSVAAERTRQKSTWNRGKPLLFACSNVLIFRENLTRVLAILSWLWARRVALVAAWREFSDRVRNSLVTSRGSHRSRCGLVRILRSLVQPFQHPGPAISNNDIALAVVRRDFWDHTCQCTPLSSVSSCQITHLLLHGANFQIGRATLSALWACQIALAVVRWKFWNRSRDPFGTLDASDHAQSWRCSIFDNQGDLAWRCWQGGLFWRARAETLPKEPVQRACAPKDVAKGPLILACAEILPGGLLQGSCHESSSKELVQRSLEQILWRDLF